MTSTAATTRSRVTLSGLEGVTGGDRAQHEHEAPAREQHEERREDAGRQGEQPLPGARVDEVDVVGRRPVADTGGVELAARSPR